MFAVRKALSNPEQLKLDISRILDNNQGDPDIIKQYADLSFLSEKGVAESITEAAYRFCRHTPGIHVTLTGTGVNSHLIENLASIQLPPLPEQTLALLDTLFARVNCISGQ